MLLVLQEYHPNHDAFEERILVVPPLVPMDESSSSAFSPLLHHHLPDDLVDVVVVAVVYFFVFVGIALPQYPRPRQVKNYLDDSGVVDDAMPEAIRKLVIHWVIIVVPIVVAIWELVPWLPFVKSIDPRPIRE